jgi:glycerate kinase
MLQILIAPDKFKGSLNSFQVCDAIEKGLRQAERNRVLSGPSAAGVGALSDAVGTLSGATGDAFRIVKLPLADGGDGLLEVIRHYTHARTRYIRVRDPLSRTISSSWLLSADGNTAFIEMARASGLELLNPSEYDCMNSSTYGTGQLIGGAIRSGANEIVIGIGGSATNDGGIGMAAALGARFLDKEGKELPPAGGSLIRIAKIDLSQKPAWTGIRFRVASDVQNPLCGEQGASRMYAPQKGATPEMVERLEAGMLNYAALLKRDLGIDIAGRPGAGAAGGLGAGCMAFLDAELVRGVDLVLEYSGAEEQIRQAGIIITGEGKIDGQTLQGKLVAGIAALGRHYHKSVLAFCGQLAVAPEELKQMGIAAAWSIVDRPMTVEKAMRDAAILLEETACRLGELLLDPARDVDK